MIYKQEDALIRQLDTYKLSLKAEILNITFALLPLIKDQCLLDQRLMLKMLTLSQITSRELIYYSLKELFKYSNDCLTFLAEASYDSSQPKVKASLNPLVGYRSADIATDSPYLDDEYDLVTESYSDQLFLISSIEPNQLSQETLGEIHPLAPPILS